MLMTPEQEKFIRKYQTDLDFHDEVNRLLLEEVVRLRNEVSGYRAALGRISLLRQDSFPKGFEYEKLVRRTADVALGRRS